MTLPRELPDGRVPLFVITGFLGSGKTTLLNHLLAQPEMTGTAVLINEFGEIGIDQLLVSEVRDELILLSSGCVCCQYGGELSDAIRDLFAKRHASEIPWFHRLVLETTGIADPVRLIDTVVNDPVLSMLVYLDSVITTVDAVLGLAQLEEHPEPVRQVALADRLVLTKRDLASDADRDLLVAELARINPTARPRETVLGRVDPEELLGGGTLDDGAHGARLKEWLDSAERASAPGSLPPHAITRPSPHGSMRSFVVRLADEMPLQTFMPWFAYLTRTEGSVLLRVKGLLRTTGDDRPLVVQSVQWIVCPTHRLEEWPDEDRTSRLVFIARELPLGREATIREELLTLVRTPRVVRQVPLEAPEGPVVNVEALASEANTADAARVKDPLWKRLRHAWASRKA
jgi:G3E family GTPase